jgi:chloramphenicol-sensitive protein RarD
LTEAKSSRAEALMENKTTSTREIRLGLTYGLAAYIWWGFTVIYFKAVSHVTPLEILAHRIVWSLVLLGVWMGFKARWREFSCVLRHRRSLSTLLLTTVLVACNWLVFIWAITHDRVVEASLGYYINPLVNVLLGFVFLRERLRRWQWVSVALAFTGVCYLTASLGALPWIALFLAFSFAFYGLLRKTAPVDSMLGLTVETLLLLPLALGYLAVLAGQGSITFLTHSRSTDLLLLCAGAITALPLLWFAHAARRLKLATIGFLQYIAPSLQLLIGVVIYQEAFTAQHGIAFAFVWTALALYSFDSVRWMKKSVIKNDPS